MAIDRRTALRRTYLSLGMGELSSAAVFAAVAAGVVVPRLENRQEPAALWSALAPLLVILVQAGAYWLIARTWVERTTMPPSLAALYRGFRSFDIGLLGACLVGVVWWRPDSVGVALAIGAVWLFGVAEYLNYYVIRLAYPLRRWPSLVGQRRTPRLIKDLNSVR